MRALIEYWKPIVGLIGGTGLLSGGAVAWWFTSSGQFETKAHAGQVERLGGVGEIVAGQLVELTGKETRAVVLGHLLRGGQPTSFDRSLGLIFGAAAVRALVEGLSHTSRIREP
jgi:6-phosphofructokinase